MRRALPLALSHRRLARLACCPQRRPRRAIAILIRKIRFRSAVLVHDADQHLHRSIFVCCCGPYRPKNEVRLMMWYRALAAIARIARKIDPQCGPWTESRPGSGTLRTPPSHTRQLSAAGAHRRKRSCPRLACHRLEVAIISSSRYFVTVLSVHVIRLEKRAYAHPRGVAYAFPRVVEMNARGRAAANAPGGVRSGSTMT